MGYNKNNFKRIREEYATKHLIAEKAADARRCELHVALPEVARIDAKLAKTGLALMGAALADKDQRERRMQELRAENQRLNAERDAILIQAGYPRDYSDVKYECTACSDSGYVGIRMCDCMKKALTLAGFESSGMGKLIETQTFDNFSLAYYRHDPDVLALMTRNLEAARVFAETFDPATSRGIAMFGGTGLGKTHLSSAIARRVIERGYDVCYTSAVDLFADFETEQFGNRIPRGELTDKYFDCDLLILDDLGTELTNQFTVSCLYNLLNARLNRHLPMIISTNLEQKVFMQTYSERITSRILGEFSSLLFKGRDIRLQKKMKAPS